MKVVYRVYKGFYKYATVQVLLLILLTVLQKSVGFVIPLNLQALIDNVVYMEGSSLKVLAGGTIALCLIFNLILSLRYYVQKTVETRGVNYLKELVLNRIPLLRFEIWQQNGAGFYNQLLSGDIEATRGLIVQDFVTFATNIVYVVSVFYYMLSVSMELCILVLLSLVVMAVSSAKVLPAIE